LSAVLRDVADLAATVARLAALAVEWAAVGRSAVTGDVSELATSVALHALSLTVTGIVVWATALVAGSGARHATTVATASTPESTAVAATSCCWWRWRTALAGAIALCQC
jgi:hypothetical protein